MPGSQLPRSRRRWWQQGGRLSGDFFRGPSSLLAHGAAIPIPPISGFLDYEAELALVIGKTTRNVSEADALDAVFGYACFNDATFRDYQRKTSQWTVGKNFDKTGGFGPYLVTADELPPGCKGLHIESRLNGRVMQSASTTDMVFHVAPTIAMMSACMTLEPGDVIVMGTPAGVGYARKPPVWMVEGDIIEIDIQGMGFWSTPSNARVWLTWLALPPPRRCPPAARIIWRLQGLRWPLFQPTEN